MFWVLYIYSLKTTESKENYKSFRQVIDILSPWRVLQNDFTCFATS